MPKVARKASNVGEVWNQECHHGNIIDYLIHIAKYKPQATLGKFPMMLSASLVETRVLAIVRIRQSYLASFVRNEAFCLNS